MYPPMTSIYSVHCIWLPVIPCCSKRAKWVPFARGFPVMYGGGAWTPHLPQFSHMGYGIQAYRICLYVHTMLLRPIWTNEVSELIVPRNNLRFGSERCILPTFSGYLEFCNMLIYPYQICYKDVTRQCEGAHVTKKMQPKLNFRDGIK